MKRLSTSEIMKTVTTTAGIVRKTLPITPGTKNIENQTPVGMVTNRDFTEKIIAHSYPADTPIRRIMSTPLIFINPETEINTAAELMASKNIRKLPIISGDVVIGMVIASDVALAIPEQ